MKLILRIDDVGRLPTDFPEQGSDRDLSWFKNWYLSAGLNQLPCVCGVTADWLNREGLESISWLRDKGAVIAAHGTNHGVGVIVSKEDMARVRDALGNPRAYIPPFNSYDATTLQSWREAGGDMFFGGFYLEHHHLGDRPVLVENVLHYPACHALYDRATNLKPMLEKIQLNPRYPVVVTLHAPWEPTPSYVRNLVEKISSDIVSPSITDGVIWQ